MIKSYYNPEKARAYYQQHKEKFKLKQQQFVEKNYEYKMWIAAKCRARQNNILFDLAKEDIHIPEYCPFLNIQLTKILGQGIVWTNPSLDRIDPTKGYTKDNVRVISWLANSMKQHATTTQLKQFAKGIITTLPRQDRRLFLADMLDEIQKELGK